MNFVTIDCCPVPEGDAADAVQAMKAKFRQRHGRDTTMQSCYRGEYPHALPILHRCGKATQAEIVANPGAHGVIGTPNPVNHSTHELRSDGVAYPNVPVTGVISAIHVGQDWPNADIPYIFEIYRELGCKPRHPYPSGLEYHHLDLDAPAQLTVIQRLVLHPIRRGHRGKTVRDMQVYMVRGHWLPRDFNVAKTIGTMDDNLIRAIKRFQHHVGLHPTGVLDATTFTAAQRRYNWRAMRHK